MARPLIQILNIAVFPSSSPCSLKGYIYLMGDDHYRIHPLFDCDDHVVDHIPKDGHLLSLTGVDSPRALQLMAPCISIFLKGVDPNGKVNLDVDEMHSLCHTNEVELDQVNSITVKGSVGSAKVYYWTMASGLVGEVSLLHFTHGGCVSHKLKNPMEHHGDICLPRKQKHGDIYLPEKEKQHEHVFPDFPAFGTVVAQYNNAYGHRTIDDDILPHHLKITIFNIHQKDNDGKGIVKVANRFVAVPAYSSLRVDVDLKQKQDDTLIQFLHGSINFRPVVASGYSAADSMDPANFATPYACLDVLWSDVHQQLPCFEKSLGNKFQVDYTDIEPLLEVYSVFIGRGTDNLDADLSISGQIKVTTCEGDFYLFKRDASNPDYLSKGNNLLSITRPSTADGILNCDDFFVMHVDLCDAGGRFNIEGGNITFTPNMIFEYKLKYDKFLRSVIRGESGHCVVHHTVFSNAVRLEVKCALLFKTSVDAAKVYGKIATRCGALTPYSKFYGNYDLEYCKRVLFDKSEDNAALLPKAADESFSESCLDDYKSNEVVFSTSYVAMPIDSTIDINVDVYASSRQVTDPTVAHFQHTFEFELGADSPMEIQGDEFDILVYAQMIPRSDLTIHRSLV